MKKTFEYKLEPNKRQEDKMFEILETCRSVYNWALEDRRNLWEIHKIGTGYEDQCRYFNSIKTGETKNIYSHALQDALKRCHKAFQNFFRRCKTKQNPGYPRFRGIGWYNSVTFPEAGKAGAILDGQRLYLSKIGRVRIILHRSIEGKIKTCTIKKRADGWYALFSCELPDVSKKLNENPIGIDVGLISFATLSNGNKIENPKFFVKSQSRLCHYQRMMARRKKGSANRNDARHQVALAHLKIERMRKDFHHKEARKLVDQYNPIMVEDLKIQNMMQNHKLAKHISDAGWGQFISILSSKAESAGSKVIKVKAAGTSQICSQCGEVVKKKLSERIHNCPNCRLQLDRDHNAALNILNKGWGTSFGEGQMLKVSPMIREASGL
jgi:putative transposase